MATNETVATIEVRARELLRLFDAALAFTSTDHTIPVLNCVILESEGDSLLAVATDRYVLGVSRLELGEVPYIPPHSLKVEDIQRIKRTFKPGRGADPMLALTFTDAGLTVEETGTLGDVPTTRVAASWLDAKVTVWRSIITGSVESEVPADQVHLGLNPDLFAKFAKARRDHDPMRTTVVAPNKPVRVTFGDYFVGLIMPVRLDGNAVEPWTPATEAPTAPKPKRSRKRAAA